MAPWDLNKKNKCNWITKVADFILMPQKCDTSKCSVDPIAIGLPDPEDPIAIGCDATDDDSSNAAGFKKMYIKYGYDK